MSGLEGQTDYARGLVARTSFDGCGIEIHCPLHAKVIFSASKPSDAYLGGDYFVLEVPEGTVEGVFLDAHHLLIRGACSVLGDSLAVDRSGPMTLIGVPEFFDAAKAAADFDSELARRRRWLDSVRLAPELDAAAQQALAKALVMVKTQVYSAEGLIPCRWTTPDRWPHRDMWLWDSVFHAIGLRHFDEKLARNAIEAVLSVQRSDGFVPHRAFPDGASDITQPPILAFGVQQVLGERTESKWARDLYPGLVSYLAWNEANRDTDGHGLLEWFIEDDPACRSGESGMDNSPRFDEATQLDAVDFNSFMAMEYRTLSRLAEAWGYSADAKRFHSKWRSYCDLINTRCWNESTGFYHDVDVKSGRQSEVMANSGFLPLLCGAAEPHQARRLVEHLTDPRTFGTAFPVPSVAVCSRRGGEKDMWRGPVWINMNWLIAHALRSYGFSNEADRLLSCSIQELIKQHSRYGTFFEFYDDAGELDPPELDRKGRNDPGRSPYHHVIHDFGWTATLFIDMINQMSGRGLNGTLETR